MGSRLRHGEMKRAMCSGSALIRATLMCILLCFHATNSEEVVRLDEGVGMPVGADAGIEVHADGNHALVENLKMSRILGSSKEKGKKAQKSNKDKSVKKVKGKGGKMKKVAKQAKKSRRAAKAKAKKTSKKKAAKKVIKKAKAKAKKMKKRAKAAAKKDVQKAKKKSGVAL